MQVLQRRFQLKFHLVMPATVEITPSGERIETPRSLPLCGVHGPSWQPRIDKAIAGTEVCKRCLSSADRAYRKAYE